MQTLIGRHWHHLPAAEAVTLLDSNLERGLDQFELQHRQEHFGRNELTPRRRKSAFVRFLQQFNNPLIYILLASALITAVLKDPLDATVILLVVVINAGVSYIQESRAEEAIEALARSMTVEANVLRIGRQQRVPAADLVPGDIVLIQSGSQVPADLRLVSTRDLQVAEASLTGESAPVPKDALALHPPDSALADRSNMAYASTLVTYGQGTGLVVATGDHTEIGRISQLLAQTPSLETPLTRRIRQFSGILLYAILAMAAIAFAAGVARGQAPLGTFSAAIALAVAMIPEGLPAALTITLSIGVARMARRRAIVRKLPAVETLGSTTVICSDKTGTLTQNQMTVREIWTGGEWHDVAGDGYSPQGAIVRRDDPQPLPPSPALLEILRAGLLCNDSRLVEQEGRWTVQGDPTEGALLAAAGKLGLGEGKVAASPRADVIPFEAEYQYMATLHPSGQDGHRVVYVKGAAEVLIDRCRDQLDPAGNPAALDPEAAHEAADQMAADGLRVLAFARLLLPAETAQLRHSDLAYGLTLLGLQGMIDPPRAEAIAAVQAARQAGIRVKMITGDHALTAATIAAQVGLADSAPGQPTRVLSGKALAAYTDAELIEAAESTHVFARVTPEQKLRLVEALQARGHVVTMTGDGVNDAPALKQADIGVAMGITGTDVAKQAADMVLTDDNFATIEAAVEEGRSVFDNLTKIIAWTLPTNLGEGMIILSAILLGIVLPILPIQILWINMTTATVLGLVLAMEAREPGIMRRPPRDPRAPILSRPILMRIVLVGTVILLGAFGLFEWELALGASVEEARTVAVNVVVMVEIFYLLNCRSLTESMFRIGVFSNRWLFVSIGGMLLLQLLFTYLPAMNRLFSTAPIPLEAWTRIVTIGLAGYVVVEVEKAIRRWLARRMHG
jgi:Ca2+-transporting ATPase